MKMDFLLEYTPMAGLSGEERVTEIILCWTLMKVRDISLVILHPGSVDKAGHLYLVVLEAVHHWSVSIRVLDVPEAVHSPVSTVYLQTSLSVLLDSNLGVPPSPPAPRRHPLASTSRMASLVFLGLMKDRGSTPASESCRPRYSLGTKAGSH